MQASLNPAGCGRGPVNRVFRADTPHDVLGACLVAATLPPGRDVMALCGDKAYGDPAAYMACMSAVASLHGWAATVDVSGLPINRHWVRPGPDGGPRRRLRDTLDSLAELRRRLAPALGLDPRSRGLAGALDGAAGEVYLTVLNQPDVQAFYTIFPSARKVYSPHGPDSLHAAEIAYYDPFCSAGPRPGPPARSRAADLLKRLVWGRDAVPPRRLRVDAAYSFNRPAPWAEAQHSLADRLTRGTMRDLFDRLPPGVRDDYRGLAAGCRGTTALLLMNSSYGDPAHPFDRELAGYVHTARRMVEREGAGTILIKPHPLNDDAWVDRARGRVEAALDGVTVLTVEGHRACPIELVLAPFDAVACGAFGSGALRTLRKIYGLRAYCPASHLLGLYTHNPDHARSARTWLDDVRGEVIII